MNTKDQALHFTQDLKLRIFPCYPRGHEKAKQPMVAHWKEDATTLEGVTRKNFGGPVDKLIGLLMEANGLFAVDIDTPEAAATWEEWRNEYGMAEPGPWQKTPRGAHYIFKMPAFDFSSAVGKLAPGMDLRADGYICTGGDGSGYTWQIPLDEGAQEAPDWLQRKIKAIAAITTTERSTPANTPPLNPELTAAYWLKHYAQKAAVGTRNENAYLMGLQLYYAGISLDYALSLYQEWSTRIPQDPSNRFTSFEYTRTIKSAYSGERKDAGLLPAEAVIAAPVTPAKAEPEAPATESPEPQKPPKIEGSVKTDTKPKIEEKPVKNESIPEPEFPEMATRKRFNIRGPEFFLEDREPIPHIVEDLVLESSVNLWYGQYGSKKTWSLLDLGVCVSCGKTWLNFKVNPCNVLIIDEESGERRLAERLGAILRGELAPDDALIKSVSSGRLNLRSSPGDLEALTMLINETQARLVIIDALADVMLGGDENAVKDTQPVFAALRYVSELTGAAFIVIHHSNKLGGYRGSSAIAGAIDSMLLIESRPESDLINFKTEKVRDGKPLSFAGSAIWSDTGFHMMPAECSFTPTFTKAQRYTLDYFTEKGDHTLADLSDYAGELYAHETLKKAIQMLINQGLLTRKDEGGRRAEATYGIKGKANG